MNNYELDAFGRIGRHVSELDVGARINGAESAALTGAGGAFACVRPSLPGMQAHVQPSAFPSHIMASFHGQVPQPHASILVLSWRDLERRQAGSQRKLSLSSQSQNAAGRRSHSRGRSMRLCMSQGLLGVGCL